MIKDRNKDETIKTVELKIFNQTLKINLSNEDEDFYRQIASNLDNLMFAEEKKSEFISDVKVAVRVAFMLALEKEKLIDSLHKSDEVIDRIADNLKNMNI